LNLTASFAAHHDIELMTLAVFLCLASSLCVFRLRSRMRQSEGVVQAIWIFLAGLEAGVALWATQFLALMAFRPGVAAGYDPMAALGALLVGVIGTTTAFTIAWTGRDRTRALAGSTVLTLAMGLISHSIYQAYHPLARVVWEPATVWLAMSGAMVMNYGSLIAAGRARTFSRQLGAAALLTVSVLATHFMTLAALTLVPDAKVAIPTNLVDGSSLTFVVVMLAALIVTGGLGSAYIDDAQAAATVMRLRRLANAAREGIVVMADDRINDANAYFAGLVGVDPAELTGRSLFDEFLRLEPVTSVADSMGRRDGWLQPSDPELPAIPVEVLVRDDDGVDSRGHTIITMRDMREQRAAENRIRYLADHDNLTGLPNRRALQSRLSEAIERANRTGELLAVVCMNLSQFKAINDLHGQATGDAVLSAMAKRLSSSLTSPSFAARYGGDEFVVVQFAGRDDSIVSLAEWMQFLLVQLRQPLEAAGPVIEPNVCLGASLYPHDGVDADTLLINADTALQRAKKSGPNSFCFFEFEMDNSIRERRNLARELRLAISNDELVVYYQPQAKTLDGAVCGFEALVRWRHPERGMIPPDQFIGIAEEQGMILELGEWVLRRSCTDAASWPRPISVAVNLSPIQLSQPDLADRVRQILFETGLPPSRLELEVTESALFRNYQGALDTLRRLKAMGLRVSMDDFGTGFSSLSTLQSFPFDKIKIDKSFVEGIGKLERSTVIVRAVLGIGRGLDIPVVAEGVETQEQLEFLRSEACDQIQGYLLGRPAPIADYAHIIERRSGMRPWTSPEIAPDTAKDSVPPLKPPRARRASAKRVAG
jgi:diguanylate cyclase (GGDEF)-like protein